MTYSVAGTGGCATATATRAVTVTANPTISALSDTTRVCGTSTVLNAGAGYSSYSWNTGAATQTITTASGGFYKVTVTNAAGCTASDSTFLSLVNANIINNDTTICLGASVRLSIDSVFPGRTACTATGLPSNLRNGLLGYWPFCGNVNDESGNGRNGVVNGAALTTDRKNTANSAYAFTPGNFINLPTTLSWNNLTALTFSGWANFSTIIGGQSFEGNTVIELTDGPTSNQWPHRYFIIQDYNKVFFSLEGTASAGGFRIGTPDVSAGQWYHIVGVIDGNQAKLYLNGSLVSTGVIPISQFNLGAGVLNSKRFGLASNNGDNPMHGKIDDIAIWSRALSNSEIQQLYSNAYSISWSPGGATGNSITVSPTQTTTYYVSVSDGVNTCTDSVRVTVTPPPIAGTLSGTQALCIGSTTTFASTASGGTWSSSNATVATVNATTGLVTALTPGNATITYSVAGTGGCATATATRSVTVTAPPNAGTLSGTQALCIGSTSNFTSTATGGSWQSSNTSVATINSSTGLVTALSAGTATMTYSVAGTGGCATATATRSVTVTAPPSAGTLSGTQALCVSSTTNFTSTTTGGIWSSSNLSVASINATTGLVTALTPGTAVMTYSVAGTGGCATATATLSVTVTAPPNAGTLSGTQALCIGGTTTFLSTASGGFWSSSNATIATIDPVTGLIITLSPGTVTISYTVAGTGGCATATATSSFTVHPKPSVSFSINNAAQCVNINSFVFTNNSTISAGTMTHTWNFGNNVSLSAVSPTYTYPTAGAYTVTLVSTSAEGCSDSTNRSVIVHALPTGTLQPPATALLCEGGSLVLTANGGSTYQWFLNNAAIAGATNSTHLVTLPGIYTVNLISGNGCIATANGSVTIQLVVKPTANFSYTNYCASFPTQFNNQSTTANSNLVNYNWVFGAGLGTSQQENPVFTFPGAGTYNVSLTVTPVACPSLASSITKPVTVIAPPTSQRYQSLNAIENRDLQLNARTYSGATYLWSPSRGLSNERIANPIYNYNQETEYVITITTGVGCIIKDTQLVRIFKAKEIYVPKAFSPNKDGSNDNLSPKLVGIRTLTYFKIYNRWGQLLYQTSNANEGWDGTYRGAKQPMESYVWIAEGIDIDNQIIKRTGTFLLIR
jgi:gliding motility-associated-like protein